MKRINLEHKRKELEQIQKSNGLGLDWYKNSFTQVPNMVIVDHLPSLTFHTYCILLMHGFGKGWCNPSQALIAKEIGLKKDTGRVTVNRHIRKLEKKGYVRVEHTKGRPCKYYLLKKPRGP